MKKYDPSPIASLERILRDEKNGTHVFNYEFSRLEPVDSKCIYCDRGYSQERGDNYFTIFYQEDNRINSALVEYVKYYQIFLEASRCPNCLKIHRESKLKAILVSCGIELVVMCITASLIGFEKVWIWIVVFILSVLILILIYPRLDKIFVRQKGILTKHDGASKYSTIKTLMRHGWTFEKPTTD
jgi:uncharacterized membrane protein YobD (UPF0266 family)